MSALMITTQALVGPGDRVVAVTPLWPNLVEIPKILGADVECMPLDFGPAGWSLNVERLLDLLTPATRAVYINAPNNPTGWTLGAPEQQVIPSIAAGWHLDHRPPMRTSASTMAAGGARFSISRARRRLVSTNPFEVMVMTGMEPRWIVG